MAATERACLQQWRKDLLQQVSGKVLEIGSGTGVNIEYYTTEVSHLLLSEPDKNMRRQLAMKIAKLQHKNITISSCSAEKIDADSNSFDFVISALVCCSVTDLDATLTEIKRVLKPGGSFVFLEHVAAEDGTKRRVWQRRINPVWRKLAGNCHLIRETEAAILKAGFDIQEIKKESMRKAPPIVRPTIRGIAVKPLTANVIE